MPSLVGGVYVGGGVFGLGSHLIMWWAGVLMQS